MPDASVRADERSRRSQSDEHHESRESVHYSRRVALVGGILWFAGCLDRGDGGPAYTERTPVTADGDPRNESEQRTAATLVEREPADAVSSTVDAEIRDHEFVQEDDYRGSTVQGTIENQGDDRLAILEVRVRVYGEEDEHLGRYMSRTGDLEPGEQWAFTVIVLEAPTDIASYDVDVLAAPG